MSTILDVAPPAKHADISRIHAAVKQSEFGPIPADWRVRTLDELDPFITSGSRGWARFYSEIGDPFIRITNVSRSSIYLDLSSLKFVDIPDNLAESKRTELLDGDILVSITADIGIIGYVDHRLEKPAYINQHLALVRFDPAKANSKYLSYFWASDRPQNLFRGLTDQGAKAGMSLEKLRTLKFAGPKPDEQWAIAAALSDVDALIGTLDKFIAKKRAIKLTVQVQLLSARYRLTGFTKRWKPAVFGDLARPRSERIDPRPMGDGFCIELDVIEQGTGRLTDESGSALGVSLKSCFRCGDVLFGKLRAYLRKFWLADRDGICSTEIWALAPYSSRITPEYLFYLVQSDPFIEAASVSYGTHMPRSDWNIVRNLPFMIPEIDEQCAIATVLTDMDAEIAALERRRDKMKAIKQGMMQQLLTGRVRLVQPEAVA